MLRGRARSITIVATSIAIGFLATQRSPLATGTQGATTTALPAPSFHHLHLNSPDPAGAVDAYHDAYSTATPVTVGGFEGIRSVNGVTLLFTRVDRPAPAPGPDRVTPAAPQTAFWHHVWASNDARALLRRLRAEDPTFDRTRLIPQYTGPEGEVVDFSSDTIRGFMTTAELQEARRSGAVPTHRGGYFNWYGPDGVVMETPDGGPENYTIVGMFQNQPYCAVFWYQRHLNAATQPATAAPGAASAPSGPPESDCDVIRGTNVSWPSTYARGHYREPFAQSVYFDDVRLRWYLNQEDTPLVSTRGQLLDHIAVGVTDLDRWLSKLRAEDVTILEEPYAFGDTRAFLIEGPSQEALELVEVLLPSRDDSR